MVSACGTAGIVISSDPASASSPCPPAGGLALAGEISRATVVSSALPSDDAHLAAQDGSWVASQFTSGSLSIQARSSLNAFGHSSTTCALPYPSVASSTARSWFCAASTAATLKSARGSLPHRLVVTSPSSCGSAGTGSTARPSARTPITSPSPICARISQSCSTMQSSNVEPYAIVASSPECRCACSAWVNGSALTSASTASRHLDTTAGTRNSSVSLLISSAAAAAVAGGSGWEKMAGAPPWPGAPTLGPFAAPATASFDPGALRRCRGWPCPSATAATTPSAPARSVATASWFGDLTAACDAPRSEAVRTSQPVLRPGGSDGAAEGVVVTGCPRGSRLGRCPRPAALP